MIYLTQNFNDIHTFECGQCFRWNPCGDGGYIGVAGGRVCRVFDGKVYCPDSDNGFWESYFALDEDYDSIKSELEKRDPELKKCIEYGGGIRILHQDLWETIISFIISANNNIPRIKKIIETLCRTFGDRIESEEPAGEFYSFPTADKISALDISDLGCLRAGYRDKYIADAAAKVSSGEVSLGAIPEMSTPDAKRELMKIKGVGGKVADCILLFSCGRYETFPKDVWIKRVVTELYGISEAQIDGFINDKYGNLAGFAQQYLYFWARDNKIGTK